VEVERASVVRVRPESLRLRRGRADRQEAEPPPVVASEGRDRGGPPRRERRGRRRAALCSSRTQRSCLWEWRFRTRCCPTPARGVCGPPRMHG
jgi:hypothetical protein